MLYISFPKVLFLCLFFSICHSLSLPVLSDVSVSVDLLLKNKDHPLQLENSCTRSDTCADELSICRDGKCTCRDSFIERKGQCTCKDGEMLIRNDHCEEPKCPSHLGAVVPETDANGNYYSCTKCPTGFYCDPEINICCRIPKATCWDFVTPANTSVPCDPLENKQQCAGSNTFCKIWFVAMENGTMINHGACCPSPLF